MKQERSNEVLQQYGVGPIQFSGTNDALYERHLIFDHVIHPKQADLQDQYEAAARAIFTRIRLCSKDYNRIPRD